MAGMGPHQGAREILVWHILREIARRKAQGPSGPELQLAAIKQWSAPSKHGGCQTSLLARRDKRHRRGMRRISRGARGRRWAPASIAHIPDASSVTCMSVDVLTMPLIRAPHGRRPTPWLKGRAGRLAFQLSPTWSGIRTKRKRSPKTSRFRRVDTATSNSRSDSFSPTMPVHTMIHGHRCPEQPCPNAAVPHGTHGSSHGGRAVGK
jgi:hypothetical protein